jgi:hypothetical protein
LPLLGCLHLLDTFPPVQCQSKRKIQIGYFAANADWRRAFLSPQQRVLQRLHRYFEVTVLRADTDTDTGTDRPLSLSLAEHPPFDLFIWDDYPAFDKWVTSLPASELPPALLGYVGGALVQTFESKSQWKHWMRQIGLQRAIGKSYVLENASYPCMFKLVNNHFGTGVKIAHSRAELAALVASAPAAPANAPANAPAAAAQSQSYIIEEALAGLGLAEVTLYGGAFSGRLTSLRCLKKNYDVNTLNKLASDTGKENVFVAGQKLLEANTTLVACGAALVKDVAAMISEAKFTGPFCVDVKFDSQKNAKFLEINARMCRTLTHRHDLFASTYLPIAFAIRDRLKRGNASQMDVYNGKYWFGRKDFRLAYLHEKNLLRTGGTGKLGEEDVIEQEFSESKEYVELLYGS